MSLIHPDNHVLIFAVLLISVGIGVLGDKYKWFGKVSGILVTIALAATATSTGLIPSASDSEISVPAYSFVFDYLVPISIPLLLFSVHLKKIIREPGKLLLVFLIGSGGVVLGAILADYFISFGEETYKIEAVFIGTYTGGSVNIMAVASTFDSLQSDLFLTVISVDYVFTNIYFMLLFLISALGAIAKGFLPYSEENFMDDGLETEGAAIHDLEIHCSVLL